LTKDIQAGFGSLSPAEKEAAVAAWLNTQEDKKAAIERLEASPELMIERSQSFSREGFRAFFKFMHGTPLHTEGEKWVDNIFDAIEKGFRKILLECFRGSGKTTVVSKFFFLYWLGHFPHTTNGLIRVNTQKANETLTAVRTVIETDKNWDKVFPSVRPGSPWGEKAGYYLKRTDISQDEWDDLCRETNRPISPTFIGYGFDSGSIQGFRTNGLLVIDDIHVKENTRSDRQLEDVKDFVKFQLMPIPVPDECVELWNFTPWLTNDAYADRKATGLYYHSKSPVMWPAENGEGVVWPEKFGIDELDSISYPFAKQKWVLAWPERFGLKQIATQYLSITHIPFAREYLLDLEATKGQKLKAEWLHYFPASDIDPSWPVIMGNDYASVSDKLKHKDRDYFATAIGRVIPGGGIVLVDGFRGHLTKGEALQKMISLAGIYPTTQMIGVENIGKGEEFYNDLAMTNDVWGHPLPLMPIKHGRKSKGDRFEDYLGPRFQMSRIWVSNVETPFINSFENEWLMYPNAEHDDCIDAVYMMAKAGEGHLPSKAERTSGKVKEPSPYEGLGRM
jgi:phage terminase large subunit-like protein